MEIREFLRNSLQRAEMLTTRLLDGFTDEQLLVRATRSANHIAWQLGHLIVSTHQAGEMIKSGSMPKLPDDFSKRHSDRTAAVDEAETFLSKAVYLEMLADHRRALMMLIQTLDYDTLLGPAPDGYQDAVTTIADLLHLTADHEILHAGQISVVRRVLGMPNVF